MDKITNFTVKWHHSLRFKLFIMMSIYLLITVVAISWENGRNFWNLMTAQSKTATLESSQKAAAAFANLIELWSSTIYTSMHSGNDSQGGLARTKQLRSVLSSNKEFAAFSIYRATPNATVTLISNEFTPYRDSLLFEKTNADSLKAQLEKSAQNEAFSLAKMREEMPARDLPAKIIKSLSGDLRLEILELIIPFKLDKSSEMEIAILHVLNERIRTLTEKKANMQSLVV